MRKVLRKVKRKFWKSVEPFWPHLRDFMVRYKIVWHEPGRQRRHLGYLHPHHHPEDFRRHMHTRGFHNHHIAWVDEDELYSLRRMDGETHQYHLRVFKDGEVRGHYEVAPEEHLWHHFWEIGMEGKHEHFVEFIGEGWVDFTNANK